MKAVVQREGDKLLILLYNNDGRLEDCIEVDEIEEKERTWEHLNTRT